MKITVPGEGVKAIRPMALSKPMRATPLSSDSSGAPDISGGMRRAHQVLAGVPTGVRAKSTSIKPPKMGMIRPPKV